MRSKLLSVNSSETIVTLYRAGMVHRSCDELSWQSFCYCNMKKERKKKEKKKNKIKRGKAIFVKPIR
ncbi:hypothetical protein PUN28_004401 [Cardiocondyla obscurior]|uniref:Uncharacterized protein n=1 Tax=Cardiocondyla obscurior TaxID=286306 RepID=A0AAW2GD66_9HYME